MGKAGLGNVVNPLMVVSCICGFLLYSAFFLKERLRAMQYVAFVLCVAGAVAICMN